MNITLDEQEVNTILAALRYYQQHDQGEPANRSSDIQDIACPDPGSDTSLDNAGIDALCERLNCGPAEPTPGPFTVKDASQIGETGFDVISDLASYNFPTLEQAEAVCACLNTLGKTPKPGTYVRFECGQEDRVSPNFGPFEFVQITYDGIAVKTPGGDDTINDTFARFMDGWWLDSQCTTWSDIIIWTQPAANEKPTPTMWSLVTNQGTAAAETSLCTKCFADPANQAFAREMASQSDDIDPKSQFIDVSENDAVVCCICGDDDLHLVCRQF